jgi:hypothetical protein
MRWLLPLAGLAALAALLWMFLPANTTPVPEGRGPAIVTRAQSPEAVRQPVIETAKPLVLDVSKVKTDLTDTFTKLTETLTTVKDAQSAETALPTLEELAGKLETAKTTMKDLGETGKTTISTLVKASETKLRELIEKVLAIPGIGERIKTVADTIKTRLSDLSAA